MSHILHSHTHALCSRNWKKAMIYVASEISIMQIVHIKNNILHPITTVSFEVEKNKHAKITPTRINEVRNFQTYTNLTLNKLGFLEWIEIHDIFRIKKLKDIPQLLANLAQKFKLARDKVVNLNILPPPKLHKIDHPALKKKQTAQGDSKKRKRMNISNYFLEWNLR
ncbi:hypothetical protein Tco_1246801 [Tanacetum coccineum]